MSVLTQEEAARIARLARLALTADELQLFSRQLAGILTYVEQLQEVDTEGVPATSHPMQLEAPFRPDGRRPSLPRGEALAAAPEADAANGLFKVPRVIGG